MRDRFFKNPLSRIKGGFKSEKYKELLMSLDEDINRIVLLTSGAIALEPIRLEKKRKSNAAYWTQFRLSAERLYEALHSRWPSTCACQSTHRANLRLELRRDFEPEHSSAFKILFSFETNVTVPTLPWSWRAAEIRQTDTSSHRYVGPRFCSQFLDRRDYNIIKVILQYVLFSVSVGLY
jgi:hypothetical protein